jgi:hypothetical protein
MTESQNPYSALPLEGPHEVGVGHALISLVEPHPGHEHDYNRWYEYQHFFDGAMHMPWMFAGRRWTATYELQQMRRAGKGRLLEPIEAGSYLGTYWIVDGRVDDYIDWTFAANDRLTQEGKKYPGRDNIYTGFYDRVGVVRASDDVPPARFSLVDPSPGLVYEVLEAEGPGSRDALEKWFVNEHVPSRLQAGLPASQVILFRLHLSQPGDDQRRRAYMDDLANNRRRLTALWFLDDDPRDCFAQNFGDEVEQVSASGLGEAILVAPFIPSRMGTTAYETELRPPGDDSTEPRKVVVNLGVNSEG